MRIEVPLPGPEERMLMMKHHLSKLPNCLVEADFHEYAGRTDGLSGRDLLGLCKAAHSHAVTEACQNKYYVRKVSVFSSRWWDYAGPKRLC